MADVAADPPAQQHLQNQPEEGIVTISMPPDDPAPEPADPPNSYPLLLHIPTAAASSLPKGVLHVLLVQSTDAPTAGLQAVLVPAAGSEDNAPGPDPIHLASDWELRGWLMVLATLIASITYAPPGGFEVKVVPTPETASINPKGRTPTPTPTSIYRQFMPVLRDESIVRYTMFYYGNTLAFALSLSIIMLLASQDVRKLAKTRTLKVLVALDVLALWFAYISGSCFNSLELFICLVLVFLLLLAVVVRGKYFWDQL